MPSTLEVIRDEAVEIIKLAAMNRVAEGGNISLQAYYYNESRRLYAVAFSQNDIESSPDELLMNMLLTATANNALGVVLVCDVAAKDEHGDFVGVGILYMLRDGSDINVEVARRMEDGKLGAFRKSKPDRSNRYSAVVTSDLLN